jgi:hypothetical protein
MKLYNLFNNKMCLDLCEIKLNYDFDINNSQFVLSVLDFDY